MQIVAKRMNPFIIIAAFSFIFLANPALGQKAENEPNSIDHAGILRQMGPKNYVKGQAIYNNLCTNCHGGDGKIPALPIARAFGTGELKFGVDPYSMFQTLTKGNGLMGPQTWMTPQERYDAIHYIREKFMKPMHPKYKALTSEYLDGLPKVNAAAAVSEPLERDFGPALASQLGRKIPSVLTVKLGVNHTISYNLHSMDQAGLWRGGFLNLDSTQHYRERGEGVPEIQGEKIVGLQSWKWAHDGTFDYPTANLLPRGPLPAKWMEYHGHYLYEDNLVLSYSINGRDILEMPTKAQGFGAIVHTLNVAAGTQPLQLCVGQLETPMPHNGFLAPNAPTVKLKNTKISSTDQIAVSGSLTKQDLGLFTAAAIFGQTDGLEWSFDWDNRIVLTIPASKQSQLFQVIRFSGQSHAQLLSMAGYLRLLKLKDELPNPTLYLNGGKQRWSDAITTIGILGSDDLTYTLDTLTLPSKLPGNVWLRTSALAFFSDGRMAVSTHGGDVWIVSGIDKSLESLKWKRFATGLYEPFGLQVISGKLYVTCKDRLTRLHDFNNDSEADFYENFSADTDVSTFFHAFNFDLQRDRKGNLYYVKSGQYTSQALPGAVIKVSPDGEEREVYCTGFRTPNGMGILPDGRLTASDNQGSWMPASKVSLLKPGGFYGYVQTHTHKDGLWAPDGGRIDHRKVVPPKAFDQPLIWMPQDFDNSSGGQLWVDDPRWGPLSGRLLHTSFGKGWLYYMMLSEVEGLNQAAIVRLKIDALTGIHRARVNPSDGQVYATGLNGWNGGGRKGLSQGHIHRFRYTGKPARLLTDTQVRHNGIELKFNFQLDSESAKDSASYQLKQWNYKWAGTYGSRQYSPNSGKVGRDNMEISNVKLAKDRRSVLLQIPDIKPANQVKINLNLQSADGEAFTELVYLTVNKVPNE